MKAFIRRCQWLRAWKSVIRRQAGELRVRHIYANSFNCRKFWFQKRIDIDAMQAGEKP